MLPSEERPNFLLCFHLSVGTSSLFKVSKEQLGGDHGNMAGGLRQRGPFPKSNFSNNDQYFCL